MNGYEKPLPVAFKAISTIRRRAFAAPVLGTFALIILVVTPTLGRCPGSLSSMPAQAIHFYQQYLSDLRYGRCRFEPSCSQYALEVIQDRGLLVGSALAADRLIRCNRRASHFYERGASGRLLDPPGGGAQRHARPRVPGWLLPEPGHGVMQMLLTASDSLLAGPTHDRLLDYAEFAEVLAGRGDCVGVGIEYGRVAHIVGSRRLEYLARMGTGNCFFGQDDWAEAATEFSAAASLSTSNDERNTACFMLAATRFSSGDYTQCRQVLDQCKFRWTAEDRPQRELNHTASYRGPVSMENWLFMQALCAMAVGNWPEARQRLDEIRRAYPDSPKREHALMLERASRGGTSLPRRSPMLASVCSAVLPGSGQVYAGSAYDGLRHFLFNSLLLYSVYHLAEDENYTAAYLLASVELPFYVGNIIGAKRTAERYNKSRRLDYLNEAISANEE